MRLPPPLPKSTVCLQCGDPGFQAALLLCATCRLYAVHRYCLDKPTFRHPVTWFCEDCGPNSGVPSWKTVTGEEESGEGTTTGGGSDEKLALVATSEKRGGEETADDRSGREMAVIPRPAPPDGTVWSGSLYIANKHPGGALVAGFHAFVAATACERARQEAESLPPAGTIRLELVPRRGVWPASFGKRGPAGDDMAMVFLAVEGEGEGEGEGATLVREMVRQDMAMRGAAWRTEEAELLVFTSAVLPADHCMIGGRFYLWGVFRERRKAFRKEATSSPCLLPI